MSGAIAYGESSHRVRSINKDNDAVLTPGFVDTTGKQIINLHVSAKKLPKLDLMSESDPMCVLLIPINGRYVEVARSEVVWNNNNPEWVSVFQANYLFNITQPLRFSIYDVDSEKTVLNDHDYIGSVDTDLSTLVQNLDRKVDFNIKSSKTSEATFTIVPEQLAQCSQFIKLQASVRKVKKMRTFSKNNPYLLFSKCSESGKSLPIFKSETVPKCYQCLFKPCEIPLQNLCNGDLDLPIDIAVIDNHVNHPDVPIGKVTMSVRNFMENINQPLQFQNEKGKKVGELIIKSIETFTKPTFTDYIRTGVRFNLITAVDFTASNGSPSSPNSLHFISQYPNQYEQCISAVGQVVCPYDADQQFPAYGFGGKIMTQTSASHCFPLNLNPENPCCAGLPGILAAYKSALHNVALSGPTCFAPVIEAATGVAVQSFESSMTYTILLIITDGCINDYNQTADAIVEASDKPISIIIVGVGNADFRAMDDLDGDGRPLRNRNGRGCSRDIVQFVPFNKYVKQEGVGLAEEVLAEVPNQVIQYCMARGIRPAPPVN